MALEPAQSATTPTRDKVRLRFRKDGDLRLVSHRDLMKCFERMCRRAALPVVTTQGYHPQPRIVFPLSLALGIAGLDEAVEIELEGPHDPEVVAATLARVAPPGLTILSARRIPLKASGQARRACFRVPLPSHLATCAACAQVAQAARAGLAERIQSLLSAKECWFERTRPNARRLDLRPFVRDLCLREDTLEIDLWVTPTGTARPDEVLTVLGLAGLLEEVVLARTLLELTDETPTPGDAPPPVPSGEGRVGARSVSEGQV
jgi:radical SAM-linked protein